MIPGFRIYNSKKDIYADVSMIHFEQKYALDTIGNLHNLEDSYLLLASNFKDKNGKTIYSGDIVKSYFVCSDTGQTLFDIEIFDYDKNVCAFGLKPIKNNSFVDFIETEYNSQDYEIVGNIYQDKELTK